MDETSSPIRRTDLDSCELAKSLIVDARTMSLAVLLPQNSLPFVSRVAVATTYEGWPISLVSDLSIHTRALKNNPNCSLLLGEVDGPNTSAKGDPLNQPRVTLQAEAQFIGRELGDHFQGLMHRYLSIIPKAKLYADFADFSFAVFKVKSASLNGGFGKAFELTPSDLGLVG